MLIHLLKKVLLILIQRGCIVALRVKMQLKRHFVDRHNRDEYTLATKLHAGFIKTFEDRIKCLTNS